MSVYFIQAGDGGNIKIGFTKNMNSRFRVLQTHCPQPPKLIGLAVNGDRKLEANYHDRFASFRMHGEWFSAAPEILTEAALWPVTKELTEAFALIGLTGKDGGASITRAARQKERAQQEQINAKHRIPYDATKVLAAFGGLTATAKALGHAHLSTVQGWKERGRVPYWRRDEIYAAFKKRKIPLKKVEKAIWGDA